jgi:predicted dehydrogenase
MSTESDGPTRIGCLTRKQRRDEMTGKLGIGVVGLTEGLTMLVTPDRPGMEKDHVTVRAGCDSDPEKLEAARSHRPNLYYTQEFEELLGKEDIDIIAVYTPDSTHGTIIEQALAAGKHVICTKPVVNTVEDAARVAKALRQYGGKLFVGQSTRFFHSFQRQRREYECGAVGDLELVDAHYIHRMDWFYEKSPWAATATDWVFLGLSHPIDLLVWYLGEFDEVYATGTTSALGKRYGATSFDIYNVNVRATDGRIGRCMGNYGVHELPSARNAIELVLYGSKSTTLAQYHDMRYAASDPDGTEHWEDALYKQRGYYFNDDVHGKHFGEFANYADYFARALKDGSDYSPNGVEGLYTFCVMEAVRRSATENRPVSPREVMDQVGIPGVEEGA